MDAVVAGRACSAERRLTAARRRPGGPRPSSARAVRTYLDHLAVERGLAANTLTSYRRDLRRYLRVPGRAGRSTDLDEVTEADVTGVPDARCARATPTTRRCARRSAARAVVAVRGFHKFAVTRRAGHAIPEQ